MPGIFRMRGIVKHRVCVLAIGLVAIAEPVNGRIPPDTNQPQFPPIERFGPSGDPQAEESPGGNCKADSNPKVEAAKQNFEATKSAHSAAKSKKEEIERQINLPTTPNKAELLDQLDAAEQVERAAWTKYDEAQKELKTMSDECLK